MSLTSRSVAVCLAMFAGLVAGCGDQEPAATDSTTSTSETSAGEVDRDLERACGLASDKISVEHDFVLGTASTAGEAGSELTMAPESLNRVWADVDPAMTVSECVFSLGSCPDGQSSGLQRAYVTGTRVDVPDPETFAC